MNSSRKGHHARELTQFLHSEFKTLATTVSLHRLVATVLRNQLAQVHPLEILCQSCTAPGCLCFLHAIWNVMLVLSYALAVATPVDAEVSTCIQIIISLTTIAALSRWFRLSWAQE